MESQTGENMVALSESMERMEARIEAAASLFERTAALMEERESAIMLALQASSLTPREAQVLYWISKGKRHEEIGLILGISKRTANHHSEAVLRKLGTETRGAAALVAFEAIQQRSVASRGQ